MSGCGSKPSAETADIQTHKVRNPPERTDLKPISPSKVTVRCAGIDTDLYFDSTHSLKGTVLLLPGWNFPKHDWYVNGLICKQLLNNGYALVMPEMGKSVYPTRYFAETRKDWTSFPTLLQLTDSLIPELKKKYSQLFAQNNKNIVIGFSTGARGAMLTAARNPDLWTHAVCFAGDYVNELQKNDNLLTGIYGPYHQFPERWQGTEHPDGVISELKAKLFLAHGKKDPVVPVRQTEEFFLKIKQNRPELYAELHIQPEGKHDYHFINAQINNVLKFIER